LDRWLRHEPIQARPITTFERARKWVRRRPAIAALTASVCVGFVTGLAGVTWQWRRAQSEWERAEGAAHALRENLYAADMGLVFQAWESDRAQHARDLLEKWRPQGQRDLRGFEWRHLYGLTRPSEQFVFTGSPAPAGSALSADDKLLAIGSSDGRIDIWDFEEPQLLRTLTTPPSLIYSVAISPDGRMLANTMASSEADANGTIYLWDLQTFTLKQILRGHTKMTTGVAFSPNGKLLASVMGWAYNTNAVGEIFLWDLSSGTKRSELTGHDSSVGFGGVAFAPNGQRLATAHGDGAIRIWDLRTERIEQTLRGHNGLVVGVKFSPDGTRLASGGIDGSVRLWRLEERPSGEIVSRHNGPVYCVAFSPEGQRLVSGSMDTTARLWDLEQRQELRRFRGHSGRVWSVSFAADGRRIVTCGPDGAARLWQADTGKSSGSEIFPYPSAGAFLISPDSRWIIWNRRFWELERMTEVSQIYWWLVEFFS
jgi:WD40 repeat protein